MLVNTLKCFLLHLRRLLTPLYRSLHFIFTWICYCKSSVKIFVILSYRHFSVYLLCCYILWQLLWVKIYAIWEFYITLNNKSSKSPFTNAVLFYIRLLKNKLTSYIHSQQQISFGRQFRINISLHIFIEYQQLKSCFILFQTEGTFKEVKKLTQSVTNVFLYSLQGKIWYLKFNLIWCFNFCSFILLQKNKCCYFDITLISQWYTNDYIFMKFALPYALHL